jgi:lysyl-tRNA synthetase class 2
MQELKYQFHVIQAIRNFFHKEGFMDVLTPPMVQNPGMETHIHPFEIYSKKDNKSTNQYLHTSPEFHMKKLLTSEEFNKIFTISYCFRDEPRSPIHRNQFVMCEWYRKHERYEAIMDDCENLILFTSEYLKEVKAPIKKEFNTDSFQRVTVQELFQEFLKINILDFLDTDDLINKIKRDFKNVPLPDQRCEWDDYYFLLFLNEIEPHLANFDLLLLYEFPAHLSALSTIKKSDPRVCERFEIYLKGIELCNCFNELTDLNIQKKRFDEQAALKKNLYQYALPEPTDFYETLANNYPQSSGVALGVERLAASLLDIENPFFN